MTWHKINFESKKLLELSKKNSLTISTAESCTGGLIASAIIHNPGSSHIFNKGYITYSNQSKIDDLSVKEEVLDNFGSVSKECCIMMLNGLLKKSKANIGIAVTGIAGPDGSSEEKPLGTVWISFGNLKNLISEKIIFKGSRLDVRLQTTLFSLKQLNKFISQNYS